MNKILILSLVLLVLQTLVYAGTLNADKYGSDGYNDRGYDVDGYNRKGYNLDGYDPEGYNKDGYCKDGYDVDGRNKDGRYNKNYDKHINVHNPYTYDKDGYNSYGYDVSGYTKDGGYDKKYDYSKGRDKQDYNEYNKEKKYNKVYDNDGYDKDGYNFEGYNKDGYCKDGYDRKGYNKNGRYTKKYDRRKLAYIYGDINVGYDKDGYDTNGYNRDGYNKHGYDKDGYNTNGYDNKGYSKTGKYDKTYDFYHYPINNQGGNGNWDAPSLSTASQTCIEAFGIVNTGVVKANTDFTKGVTLAKFIPESTTIYSPNCDLTSVSSNGVRIQVNNPGILLVFGNIEANCGVGANCELNYYIRVNGVAHPKYSYGRKTITSNSFDTATFTLSLQINEASMVKPAFIELSLLSINAGSQLSIGGGYSMLNIQLLPLPRNVLIALDPIVQPSVKDLGPVGVENIVLN